jgi:hypothetical protein
MYSISIKLAFAKLRAKHYLLPLLQQNRLFSIVKLATFGFTFASRRLSYISNKNKSIKTSKKIEQKNKESDPLNRRNSEVVSVLSQWGSNVTRYEHLYDNDTYTSETACTTSVYTAAPKHLANEVHKKRDIDANKDYSQKNEESIPSPKTEEEVLPELSQWGSKVTKFAYLYDI